MSIYKNFVDDFPDRCSDILKWGGGKAKIRDREVTLMLMVASAGFLVPFERLRPSGHESASPHPSHDTERFPVAANSLQKLLGEKFWSSCLWGDKAGTWKSGKLQSISGTPDEWMELRQARLMSRDKGLASVLRILRNALAHGNIYTTGSSQIENIIFVSENRIYFEDPEGKAQSRVQDYHFLSVAPNDFHQFLLNWFAFLGQLDLDQSGVYRILDDVIKKEALVDEE